MQQELLLNVNGEFTLLVKEALFEVLSGPTYCHKLYLAPFLIDKKSEMKRAFSSSSTAVLQANTKGWILAP